MLVLALATAACGSSAEPFDPAVLQAMEQIGPGPIEEHMRRLADDALEGRATGTRGYLMAADYVARRFEELGLRAAGDDDGYFQSVPLRSTELLSEESSMTLLRNGETLPLEIDTDFTMRGDFVRERAELTASVVFVGFGAVAPNHEYDDYAGVDVRGKIAALFRGAPAWLPDDEHAYYSSRTLKYHNAVERGAVGVLEMLLPDDRRGSPIRGESLTKLSPSCSSWPGWANKVKRHCSRGRRRAVTWRSRRPRTDTPRRSTCRSSLR
jgi:hypothetical protein